jgi:hypothetical protein
LEWSSSNKGVWSNAVVILSACTVSCIGYLYTMYFRRFVVVIVVVVVVVVFTARTLCGYI